MQPGYHIVRQYVNTLFMVEWWKNAAGAHPRHISSAVLGSVAFALLNAPPFGITVHTLTLLYHVMSQMQVLSVEFIVTKAEFS